MSRLSKFVNEVKEAERDKCSVPWVSSEKAKICSDQSIQDGEDFELISLSV